MSRMGPDICTFHRNEGSRGCGCLSIVGEGEGMDHPRSEERR
jgi:hypothetical protein